MSTLVKICGVTQQEQAEAISAGGADFIGLNFWSGSKRYLPAEKAAPWTAWWSGSAKLIGVFVNATPAYLDEVTRLVPLSALQLHGDESPGECARLTDLGHRVIKAFQVRDAATLEQIAAYPVEDILLDAYHAGERGGTGETFPWELARLFSQKYPERRLWLSGGLTPENIAAAVHGTHPFAVDVASGVEDGSPGLKDLAKVESFIHHARAER